MANEPIIATFRAQDIAKARELRDQLKSEGRRAFLTRETGTLRYGDQILVHAADPKPADDTRED